MNGAADAFAQTLADILRSEGPPGVLIERALQLLGQHIGAGSVVFTDHEDDDPSISTIAYEWCDGRLPALRGRRFVNQDFATDDSLAASARGQPVGSADVRAEPRLQPAHRDAFLTLGALAYWSLPYIANGRIKFALTVLVPQPHAWPQEERALIGDAAVRMCTMLERDRALAAMQRNAQQQAELARARVALEQSRRLSTLGLLLAGVSHELKNPLSIIGMQNTLLHEELDGSPLAEHCEAIGRAVQRCHGLVQSYLALARPAAPRMLPTDVQALCQLALDLAAHQLRPAGVRTQLEAAPMPDTWPTEPDQLLQVLVNLVLNAHRALLDVAPERRTLALRLRWDAASDTLELLVQDSGGGIAEADMPRVFEPFFTTHGGDGGTGLGLALSNRIVAALGGQLAVQSTGPQGTCMRIVLPRLTASG
ncbi:sensor histidine kinase [Pseudorhodoferax sp.]|uniref:sensor histidine kinase n=1 Tax=Pseudorhodoferax sp. TaxID=1993553 RepID=UPI002DD67887|nr:ATP-binding protein [Pseudorhodoferax sp.]